MKPLTFDKNQTFKTANGRRVPLTDILGRKIHRSLNRSGQKSWTMHRTPIKHRVRGLRHARTPATDEAPKPHRA
ncbi:MAG: hypothetical protein Q8N96_08670 [Methylovulum sp.]|nr:hypothetical protein [Methylovulum sp.]